MNENINENISVDSNYENDKLIFELSVPGRRAYNLPAEDLPLLSRKDGDMDTGMDMDADIGTAMVMDMNDLIPGELLREDTPDLPEVSEVDAVRHYTRLSTKNFGVDSGFYPLGSCTMKYNPKINEEMAKLPGFAKVHPYQGSDTVQGCLEILYKTGRMLSEITGMEAVSLQPAAGAHGEMTGLMVIKAWHRHNGDTNRKKIIVPDSAHGTNPASAAVLGYEIIKVRSDERGGVDINELKASMNSEVAGLMLTNPNTLGLFDENIRIVADIVHESGGLLYYDGANLNAIMGISRPGDMGFDVLHLNLHKTFSTPHGGGGPGAGPIGVSKRLVPFLPVPVITLKDGKYEAEYDRPFTIGRVKSFYGNFGVIVKAYAYMMSLGAQGIREVSESAVLNANYLMNKLDGLYDVPYKRICMHEFVLSAQKQKEKGVSALDIAKRLIDFGMHPPTVYFPLIVKEAMMIEPTETESKETLDAFIAMMTRIASEADTQPHLLHDAPHATPVRRLDEVSAARNPVLRWPKAM